MSKEDRHYNESPDDNDKVHVLVYVLDASTISVLLKDKDIMDTIQDIREDATDLGERRNPHVYYFLHWSSPVNCLKNIIKVILHSN